jgi:hypothetical protein
VFHFCAQKRCKTLQSDDAMTTGVMGLSDDQFWSDPDQARPAAIGRVQSSGWRGYVLDAPRNVHIGVRDTLPVMGVRCVSAVESLAHDFQRNAVVVAVRRSSSEVFVGRVFELKYTPPSKKVRAAPSPTITVTDAFAFELRERLPDLPWTPGTYALYLLVLHVATEAIVVRLLVPSGPSFHAPPVLDDPWPPTGDQPLPRYTKAEWSPAAPASHGVTLVCDGVVLLGSDARCVLEGSFFLNTAINDEEELPPSWDDDATQRTFALDPAESTQRMQAIDPSQIDELIHKTPTMVSLTLVLTGTELTDPWSCTLSLPATTTFDDAQGWFGLDLFALQDFPRQPGNYALWAFAGDVISGPTPIALILEESLAPA